MAIAVPELHTERTPGQMGSLNVRMPRNLVDYLSRRAAEDDTTVADIVRLSVMLLAWTDGVADEYGISVEEHERPDAS